MKKTNFFNPKRSLLTLLLACLFLLQGCINLKPEEPETTGKEQPTVPQNPTHYYEDAVYVYQAEVDEDVLLTGLDEEYLRLANKVYILGGSFAPASLSSLTCPTYNGKDVELETRTAYALYEMLKEMRHDGVTDVFVTSGYRSYAYQKSLNNYYVQQESKGFSTNAYTYFGADYIQKNYIDKGLSSLTSADVEAVVRSYSAAPGTSEHQTGLCLDFITSTMSGLDVTFEDTAAFDWLAENAYKFGFIMRYPKGKEGITGYTYEPWHYRFVGREAATDIYFSGLTLEEYLGAVEN